MGVLKTRTEEIKLSQLDSVFWIVGNPLDLRIVIFLTKCQSQLWVRVANLLPISMLQTSVSANCSWETDKKQIARTRAIHDIYKFI